MSDDDLAAARGRLVELGIDGALIDATPPDEWYLLVQQQLRCGGPPTMTAREAAARVGMDVAAIRRLWQINGLGDPGEEARLASMALPGQVLVADDAGETVAVRGFERPVRVRRGAAVRRPPR